MNSVCEKAIELYLADLMREPRKERVMDKYRIWEDGWEEIVEAGSLPQAMEQACQLLMEAIDEEWNGGSEGPVERDACVAPYREDGEYDIYKVVTVKG